MSVHTGEKMYISNIIINLNQSVIRHSNLPPKTYVTFCLIYFYEAVLTECDFEGSLCQFQQLTDDSDDWIILANIYSSPSSNTGPDASSLAEYYIFIEASNMAFNQSAR